MRNIWRLYGGWYDLDPATLKPARASELAAKAAPGDAQVQAARAEVNETRTAVEPSLMAKAIFRTAARANAASRQPHDERGRAARTRDSSGAVDRLARSYHDRSRNR